MTAPNRCWKCGKVIFASRQSADRAARGITVEYGRAKKHKMRAYRGWCGRWHLTRTKTLAEIRAKFGLPPSTPEKRPS